MCSHERKKPRFGEIAVQKGYCTQDDIHATLRIQKEEAGRGDPRRLTGLILVQHGFISTGQLIDILRDYERPD